MTTPGDAAMHSTSTPTEPAQPRTLPEVIAHVQRQIIEAEQEIDATRAALRAAELKHAHLIGQLQAYASLQQHEPNPATVTHGGEP